MGEHTLSLTVVSTDASFYVDQFAYSPDPDQPPANAVVSITNNDLAVDYLEGTWKADTTTGRLTEEPGAKMSITFTGVLISSSIP